MDGGRRRRSWAVFAVGAALLVAGSAYDFWHLGKSEKLIDEAIANDRLPVSTYEHPLDAIRGVPNIVGFIMVIIGTVMLARSSRGGQSRGSTPGGATPCISSNGDATAPPGKSEVLKVAPFAGRMASHP